MVQPTPILPLALTVAQKSLDQLAALIRLLNRKRMKAYWHASLALFFLNIGVFCSTGQGIWVESAYYGAPNGVSVDVTRRVQQFADYGEPFRVGSETLRIDPAPNHPKVLVVIYALNGQRISESVREGEVFYFRNGSESENSPKNHRPAIRIIRALYGARGRYVDVTALVRQFARDDQPFTVSNETFGFDPSQGQQKQLIIWYLRGSTHRDQQYQEGDQVQLR
jgi:hypothetical protein